MRISPLAVWTQNLPDWQAVQSVVHKEITLTHPAVWSHVTAYCLAIHTLIKNAGNPNRAKMAIDAVREYSKQDGVHPDVGNWLDEAQTMVSLG